MTLIDFSAMHNLMNKEMDRREFIRYLGVTVLVVIGVSGLLKALTHPTTAQHRSKGYGTRAYGE